LEILPQQDMIRGMTAPNSQPRWFHPTPDRLIFGLLALEAFLPLSARLHWIAKGWTVLIALLAAGVAVCAMLPWYLRHRSQLGTRSLLVLAVAVALPCAWFSWEIGKAKQQRSAAAAIEKLDGEVRWSEPSEPQWLRGVLGDGFLNSVWSVDFSNPKITDERVQQLRTVSPVDFGSPQVTDAGLEYLKALSRLGSLGLVGAEVSDAGLENIKGLKQLRVLWLSGTRISDAGLAHLEGLTQLQVLWLNGTNVSDAGLEHLKGLKQLRVLWLTGSKVTRGGADKVQKAFPDCTILR
jgi:hypothetical protein